MDAKASLEAKREAEEKKIRNEEKRKRTKEIKNMTSMLTEENLKLRKLLEEQRRLDEKEAKAI